MVESNNETEEVRLLKAMLERAAAYRAGRIRFPQLVSELGIGIDALVDREPEIADVLRVPWRALEEINALALDEGMLAPLDEHQANAERALSRVIACVSGVLDDRLRDGC